MLEQPMDDMAMRNWFDERWISPMDGRAKENPIYRSQIISRHAVPTIRKRSFS